MRKIKCDVCGEMTPNDDMNTVKYNGKFMNVCYDCLIKTSLCDCCGGAVTDENYYDIDGVYFCRDCFRDMKIKDEIAKCFYCGREHFKTNMIKEDGKWKCDYCRKEIGKFMTRFIGEHFTRCDQCGRYFEHEDMVSVLNEDGNTKSWYCEKCADEMKDKGKL